MLDARSMIGIHDVIFITLDTLRFDVADQLFREGRTPHLARLLPTGWEKRHSPGSFTYASHAAFFAGFLPTPAEPGRHERLFAMAFEGSETTGETTAVFDAPDIVSGLRSRGYHTVCVGGVGFFNKRTPLGSVLPGLFDESHWRPDFGVTDPRSTDHQVDQALTSARRLGESDRLFLFLNVSAIHQPNRHHLTGRSHDTIESHAAALEYVDSHMGYLFGELRKRAPLLTIICSDHGTAYGEEGYLGHRLAHPVVWTVPYAEFVLEKG